MSIALLAALLVSLVGLIGVSSQTMKRIARFNLLHVSGTDREDLNGEPRIVRVRLVSQFTKYVKNQLLLIVLRIAVSPLFALGLLILAVWRACVTPLTIDIEHVLIVVAVSYALILLFALWVASTIQYCKRLDFSFSGLLGGEIPEKLYEGDSAQIILQFPYEPPFASRGGGFGSYGFYLDKTDLNYPALEVELQSAGFTIAGEKIQRQTFASLPAIFSWNIFASSSGNFEIGIVTRFYRSAAEPAIVSSFRHKLKVVKLLGLNKRQLWLITGAFGAITGLLGVLQTLIKLKVISLPVVFQTWI